MNEFKSGEDPAAMSLTELADHIEQTHHKYLRAEFPRLDQMTKEVASMHGQRDSRLHQIRKTFQGLIEELSSHMMKEEQILFPMIRTIDAGGATDPLHCGSLAGPISQMESEHTQAGSALEHLRKLSDDYTPPDWASDSYRTMLDALARLEQDLHLHIRKENDVLFPRALAEESKK